MIDDARRNPRLSFPMRSPQRWPAHFAPAPAFPIVPCDDASRTKHDVWSPPDVFRCGFGEDSFVPASRDADAAQGKSNPGGSSSAIPDRHGYREQFQPISVTFLKFAARWRTRTAYLLEQSAVAGRLAGEPGSPPAVTTTCMLCAMSNRARFAGGT